MYRSVDPEAVVRTVERLRDRVVERLPNSGLSRVAHELHEVARTSAERAVWTARPLLWLRVAMGLLVLLILAGIVTAVQALRVPSALPSAVDLVQAIESSVNDIVFVGIGLYFLVSVEGRIKRSRVLAALHELRAIAHIIDMHQLTKDPDRLVDRGNPGASAQQNTPSSPERTLTRFELGRYLDYCSEMLALLGKIAALYAQYTTDSVALSAVDEIEDLTSGLSHKIWQKIMILHQQAPGAEMTLESAP